MEPGQDAKKSLVFLCSHFAPNSRASTLNHAELTGEDLFVALEKNAGVSKNRGTPKWMVYNGKPY